MFESGHDQEEEDYVELTSSFLKKIKLKVKQLDILIRHHHKHVNENNTIWVHDVLTDYIELFDIDELRQSEIIETILIDINFLKERGGRAEVVVTSYQLELEEFISKLSIKVKKDKENIRTLLSKVSKDLDKNNTGSLDIFKEDTFNLLLNKNQKEIILLEKDFKKEFTKEFVKLSNFITTNKEGIIKQYELLKKINQKDILEIEILDY